MTTDQSTLQDAPATLIPRRRRFEITERIGADGKTVTPLAEAEINGLIAVLKAERVQAVAVSLLFSFLNPEHDDQLTLHGAFPPDRPDVDESLGQPDHRRHDPRSRPPRRAQVASRAGRILAAAGAGVPA